MSGPSGKKRLGSRRKVGKRVEMPEDLSVADLSPVVQPEESAETFSVLSNEGQTPLETHWILSSEQKSSRRKLGSSRQSKRHNAEESSVEPYHKPTEEVEQNVSAEKLQTQMTPAAQAVTQREFSELDYDYDSIYGTHLYSAYTPGHALEPLNPSYLDAEVEIHQPVSEKLHLDQDDGESDCKRVIGFYKQVENTCRHWQVKEELHDQSEFTMAVQHISMDAEREDINEDPPQAPESLQDDLFNVKSKEIHFLGYPERSPEKNSYFENAEIKNNVEQVNSSPFGELPTNEEHGPFHCSQVRSAQVPNQFEIKEMKSSKSDQVSYTEIVKPENKEDSQECPGNLTEETVGAHQVELSVKSPTDSGLNLHDKWEAQFWKEDTEVLYQKDHRQAPDTNEAWINVEKIESSPFQENYIDDQVKAEREQSANGILSTNLDGDLFAQSVQPENIVVFESQSKDNNACTDVKRDFFSPARNRRKLGSRRRNKGSREMVYAAETCSDDDDDDDAAAKKSHDGNDPSKMKDVTCTIEAAEKETIQLKVMDNLETLRGKIHSNTTVPQLLTEQSNYRKIPDKDKLTIVNSKTKAGEPNETFLQQNENVNLDYSVSQLLHVSTATQAITTSNSSLNKDAEIEYSVAIPTISSPKVGTSTDKHRENFSFSQVRVAQHQDKELIKEVKLLETDHIKDREILIDEPTGDVDTNIENLVNEIVETCMPDLSAKSFLDSGLNPQDNHKEHPMNEHTMKVSERRDQKAYASNTMETWINTEKTDPTQRREHDIEAQGMSDVVRSAKGILSGMAESQLSSPSEQPEESFVLDSQSECNTASTDEQRESLRSQVKVFASEKCSDFRDDATRNTSDDDDDDDNHPAKIKEVTFQMETAEMDNFQGEDISDLVRGNVHGGVSQCNTLNTHSSTTVTQLLTDPSSSREMPEKEELSVVKSKTKAGEENETLPQNENVHADYLASQLLVDAEVSIATPEISTSKSSQIEYSVAIATISSPKADMSTDEQQKHFSFPQVRASQHPDSDLIKEAKLLETEVQLKVKVFAAETDSDGRDDDRYPREDKEVTVEDREEIDSFNTFQGEDMADLVRGNVHGGFSQFITLNAHSSTTVTQLLTDPSSSREMPEKEDEENESLPQNENVRADYVVSGPLVDAEVSIVAPETSTSESSLHKDAEIEYSVAKATISSPKAEMSTDEQHEHFDVSQVRDAQYPDSMSIKHLKALETGQNEDSETLSPARNRRKLGSSRRNKGSHVKVFAAETYNESADDADGNNRDKKDRQETKDITFRKETAEMQNTKRNRLTNDTNIECGPTKDLISLPKKEMEEQCEHFNISGGYSTQHLENNINKMLKQKVKPVEVAAESAGRQASQEHMKPIFKATEKIEVEVVKRLSAQEEDSISPNSDKHGVASSQGELSDTLCIFNEQTNVYSKSSLNVRDSEETFQVKNIEAVSLKEDSLESLLQAKKVAQEKPVEEIRDSSEQIGLMNVSLTSTKKRKMSSTHRSHINTQREAEMDGEHDRRALENVEVIEDAAQAGALHEEEQEFTRVEADPELHNSSRESNPMIPATHDVMTAFSEQLSSRGANLFTSQGADVTGSDRDVVVGMETFEPDCVPVSEVHVITSVDTERKKKQQLLSDGESLCTATIVNVMRGQVATRLPGEEQMGALSNIQGIITESDGAPDKNLKSPSLNSTNKKRKMGSTRRNLGTMSKGDLELKLDPSKEVALAAHVQNVMTEHGCQSREKESKPDSSGSEPTKENTGDSPSTAPAHQTGKENRTSDCHLVRRDILEKRSTSSKLDVLSEFELAGRKRKLGSHRKSRVQQTHANQSEDDNMIQTQPETSTHQHADDAFQGPEELQSNEGDTEPSSNIISKSVRNKTSAEVTPSRAHQDRVHLGQDTQNVSFGKPSDLKANPYNVVMVGDSSVGKTSFMKRAQNGKFFPDLPASAGLDTCLWTVIVDGKPVELQLWDTAGQERFRSITNQIFHRAHAFLLMYDIASSQSFTAVHYWASCIQEGAMENIPILLLGNKSDCTERTVTTEEGQNLAKEFNIDFMECSAVTGDNVIQSLEAVARLLSQKDDRRQETLALHKEPPKKKSGCC